MAQRLFLIFIFVVSIRVVAIAQTPESTPKCALCPPVTVTCPTDITSLDRPVTISGNISGGDPNALYTYQWELSAGKILAGQGTSTITVEFVPNEPTTATLTVGGSGMPIDCNRTASCTFSVAMDPSPLKADEFTSLDRKTEELHLTKFVRQLEAEPSAQAYIIAYGEKNKGDLAEKALIRIKGYLVEQFKLVPDRIVTLNGGLRQNAAVELWIVPAGAITPPSPTPTLSQSDCL